MTTDRDFDRIAMAWLADGPEELPDRVIDAAVDQIHLTRQRRAMRVPWRFQTMSPSARLAALVAIGVLATAGAVAIAGGGGRSSPIQAPKSSAGTVPLPPLDTTFTSLWHGYSVRYPAGWTVTPATRAWAPSTLVDAGDPAADELRGTDARFIATQQIYSAGQTAQQWLRAYCELHRQSGCASTSGWEEILVASSPAYVDADGVSLPPGAVTPGGRRFEAIVTLQNRAYVFTMDGNVDRADFDAFLGSIALTPTDAVDMPPLTDRFTSTLYGYSIGTRPDWTVTPATRRWTSMVPDSDFMDGFDVTADTSVGVMSQPLGGRTFDEFLAAFYQRQHETFAGSSCDDGGEPSAWPLIAIGDQTGRLEDVCSLASDEALVAVDGRVYLFELGHSDRGFPLTAFKQLLTTVTFDPANAKN